MRLEFFVSTDPSGIMCMSDGEKEPVRPEAWSRRLVLMTVYDGRSNHMLFYQDILGGIWAPFNDRELEVHHDVDNRYGHRIF